MRVCSLGADTCRSDDRGGGSKRNSDESGPCEVSDYATCLGGALSQLFKATSGEWPKDSLFRRFSRCIKSKNPLIREGARRGEHGAALCSLVAIYILHQVTSKQQSEWLGGLRNQNETR